MRRMKNRAHSVAMKIVIGCWLAFAGFLSAAGFTFTETTKEISMGLDETKASVDYAFKNETKERITIREAKGFCSCTSVQISGGKKFFEPGESGVIRINFEMGNETGKIEKVAAVILEGDDEASPTHQLKLVIDIPVLVEIEPKTVKWEIGAKAEPKTIRLAMKAEQPIHIKSVSPSTETFSQELKTIEEGRLYELVVTPKSTEKSGLTIFRLETDCKIKNHGTLQVFAVLSKPVKK